MCHRNIEMKNAYSLLYVNFKFHVQIEFMKVNEMQPWSEIKQLRFTRLDLHFIKCEIVYFMWSAHTRSICFIQWNVGGRPDMLEKSARQNTEQPCRNCGVEHGVLNTKWDIYEWQIVYVKRETKLNIRKINCIEELLPEKLASRCQTKRTRFPLFIHRPFNFMGFSSCKYIHGWLSSFKLFSFRLPIVFVALRFMWLLSFSCDSIVKRPQT